MDDKIDKTEEAGDVEVISSYETAKVISSSEPNTEEHGDEIVEQHTIAKEPGQILDTIYGTDTSEDGSLLNDNVEGGRVLY